MPPKITSTLSYWTSFVVFASATLSIVAPSSRYRSTFRPNKPPLPLMSSTSIRATFALTAPVVGGMTGSSQPQARDFARSQPRQACGRFPARGLAGAGEDGFDRVGAELSLPHGGAQL